MNETDSRFYTLDRMCAPYGIKFFVAIGIILIISLAIAMALDWYNVMDAIINISIVVFAVIMMCVVFIYFWTLKN